MSVVGQLLLAGSLLVSARHVPPVERPSAPDPMPAIVHEACPEMGAEIAGCYVSPGNQDLDGKTWPRGVVFTDGSAYVTEHELGHAFDVTKMNDAIHRRFLVLIGLSPDQPWQTFHLDAQGRWIDDLDSPNEKEADAYANCRLGHVMEPGYLWETGSGYWPTARQSRRVCRFLTSL